MRRRVLLTVIMLLLSACTSASSTSTPATTIEVFPPDPAPVIDETPTAPDGLAVVGTADGIIELTWAPARSGAVTGYEVIRVGSTGTTQRFSVDGAGFVDAGLDDGAIFTYTVVAVGPAGSSERSEPVTAQVGVDENPPSTPGRPHVMMSAGATVAIEWRESRDISGVAEYRVLRTVDDETVELTVTEPKLLDDIAPGLVATYAVEAVDTIGNRSEPSRSITVLSGRTTDDLVVVVSAVPVPEADPHAARLYRALLDAGFVVTWFDDQAFDANLTSSGDTVLLLGDVEANGFDWNVFRTDATIIGLKSMFVQAGGITDGPPKLDRLAQLTYLAPDSDPRDVPMTTTGRPKPVVYIPAAEQLPSLEIWARPTWSDEIAVAGLVPADAPLADETPAPGCRAFFPGNTVSLSEQTEAGWALLVDFIGAIAAACD